MKRWFGICLALCGLCLLAGCGGRFPDKNTIAVDKKGQVTATIAETFEKDFYDAEELESEIAAELAEYNQNYATDHITLKKFEVKNGVARLQLQYTTAEDYADYNGVTFFAGTVEEAEAAGYDLAGIFLDGDGEDLYDAAEWQEYRIVILEEAVRVSVPKNILYKSENVTSEGEKLAAASGEGLSYLVYKR